MNTENAPISNIGYEEDASAQKPDYGWRFNGKTILLPKDHSIIYDDTASQMEAALRDMSMEFYFLDRCLQCGMCTSWCSNSLIASDGMLSPRELIQRLRLGLLDLSGQEIWFCTNCGGCTTNCPYEIPLIDVIIRMRNLVVKEGAGFLPTSIKSVLASIRAYQNPWMEKPAKRSEWLLESGVRSNQSEEKILFFAGCSPSYDHRAKKIAKAAVQLLDHMGIGFVTLGEKEVCCGDGVMRVGDLDTFKKLQIMNKTNMESYGIKSIYTLSPHCSHIMTTEYFKNDNRGFLVKPFILLLHEAVQKGRLSFNRPIAKTVTYHDPCFLAKHHNIYQEPREILKKIKGIKLIEMEHNRRAGICCGGGGGGIWLDRKKGERLAEVRLAEVLSLKADMVVTACPFCLSMLEDAAKSDKKFENIQIMDICEFIARAV